MKLSAQFWRTTNGHPHLPPIFSSSTSTLIHPLFLSSGSLSSLILHSLVSTASPLSLVPASSLSLRVLEELVACYACASPWPTGCQRLVGSVSRPGSRIWVSLLVACYSSTSSQQSD